MMCANTLLQKMWEKKGEKQHLVKHLSVKMKPHAYTCK